MASNEDARAALPPAGVIADAIRQSLLSPCRSQRGAVVFIGDTVLTSGCHHQVSPFTCDASPECKAVCRRTAIHAEQSALIGVSTTAHGCDLLHVKTVDGRLVPSGPPSCCECSKLAVAYGIAGVWLFHEGGWRRYNVTDFHGLSVAAAVRASACEPGGLEKMFKVGWEHGRYDSGEHDCRMFPPSADRAWDDYTSALAQGPAQSEEGAKRP